MYRNSELLITAHICFLNKILEFRNYFNLIKKKGLVRSPFHLQQFSKQSIISEDRVINSSLIAIHPLFFLHFNEEHQNIKRKFRVNFQLLLIIIIFIYLKNVRLQCCYTNVFVLLNIILYFIIQKIYGFEIIQMSLSIYFLFRRFHVFTRFSISRVSSIQYQQ